MSSLRLVVSISTTSANCLQFSYSVESQLLTKGLFNFPFDELWVNWAKTGMGWGWGERHTYLWMKKLKGHKKSQN